jgi:opacity protein-like surface antigen
MISMRVLMLAAALVAVPGRAFADATIFLGSNTTPANRVASGLSIGLGLLLLGFEFEYAGTGEDAGADAPSLRTGMGNILVQTPFELFGVQPYATIGGGLYRERLEAIDHQETHVGMNAGGGAKIALLGPVRLRVDYRFFKLAGDPLHTPSHRVYAGLNLKF